VLAPLRNRLAFLALHQSIVRLQLSAGVRHDPWFDQTRNSPELSPGRAGFSPGPYSLNQNPRWLSDFDFLARFDRFFNERPSFKIELSNAGSLPARIRAIDHPFFSLPFDLFFFLSFSQSSRQVGEMSELFGSFFPPVPFP